MQILLTALLIAIFLTAPAAAEQESTRSSIGEDVGRDMVLISAGKFQRGCDALGPEHGAPAHPVYLESFMVDIYEVTNERLEKIMPAPRPCTATVVRK